MTPIFLIAGSPASGKTTIGHALAASFAKGMHIPVDAIQDMVVSGFHRPGPDWTPELIEQLILARANACAMAMRYRQAGFAVTVDDFFDGYSRMAEYRDILSLPQVYKILLYPTEQTTIARNLARYDPGERAEYLEAPIHMLYALFRDIVEELKASGWLVVDSTEQSVEETVAEILERTGKSALRKLPFSF